MARTTEKKTRNYECCKIIGRGRSAEPNPRRSYGTFSSRAAAKKAGRAALVAFVLAVAAGGLAYVSSSPALVTTATELMGTMKEFQNSGEETEAVGRSGWLTTKEVGRK